MAKKGFTCLKMPGNQRDFIEKNPRLAKVAAHAVASLLEIMQKTEDLKKTMQDPNILVGLLDEGTPEQAASFMKAAIDALDQNPVTIDEISEEGIEELKRQLGDEILVTTL